MCYQAIGKHNTVPFKSKLTVRYESRFLTRFAIPVRIKNRESKRSYRQNRVENRVLQDRKLVQCNLTQSKAIYM